MDTADNKITDDTKGPDQTGTTEVETQPVKYPLITTKEEEDGSITTITEDEDHVITWVRKYLDGKTVSLEAVGYEVTRHPNGDLEYKAKNGMHIKIKCGNGEDVEEARRMLGGGGVNDKAFMRVMMAQLIRFDGVFIPPEAFPKKFKAMDYLMLMGYYSEVNFQ